VRGEERGREGEVEEHDEEGRGADEQQRGEHGDEEEGRLGPPPRPRPRGLAAGAVLPLPSSTQIKVDRDPRSNLAYRRCVALVDPCSLACRTLFPDPIPRSGRSGSPATMSRPNENLF
jgi:hypothetical protein